MVSVNRPVVRDTGVIIWSGGPRSVVVTLEPPGRMLRFRLKGFRQDYTLPVEFCFREKVGAK